MVEKVARVIYEAGPLTPGPWNDDRNIWDRDASDVDKFRCREQAREVLKAMREPSSAMIAAGAIYLRKPDGMLTEDNALETWMGMIDKALEE